MGISWRQTRSRRRSPGLFKEELDVLVAVGRIADVVYHRYPDRAVLLLFYVCKYLSGDARPIDCADFAWIEPSRLTTYDFLAADLGLIQQLSSGKTF
jgi:8-oxo-dGTP diphosphatase